MCGFSALIDKSRAFDQNLIQAIDNDLYHRGPDSGGLFEDDACTLIFRRLSILDPTEGANQPMADPDGRYVIVFNGEIYNYKELYTALEQTGIRFRTRCDTEVILEGFKVWGLDILSKLEGMFALVIWDKTENTAYAARDPLGIKPLYMARKGSFLGFSSESRPLRRIVGSEIDPASLGEILSLRFGTGRHSNFRHIEMVPGGTFIKYAVAGNRIESHVFSDLLDTFENPARNMSEEEALQIVEDAVVDSVKRHLQSDVGYTVQLSGGVDSSLVTAIAAEHSPKRLKTYGVKLEDPRHDESQYRKMVIDRYNTDHHEVLLTAKDFADGFVDTCRALEGPVAHSGTVLLKALAREIGKSDKVTLVGEGADEFFAGYSRYTDFARMKKAAAIARFIPAFAMEQIPRLHNARRYKTLDPAIVAISLIDHVEALRLFPSLTCDVDIAHRIKHVKSFENRMALADQLGYLRGLLLRQDKIGMAHSVEVRTPFTHMPLAKAVNRIPHHLRMPGNITKPLLKKVSEKWLPHDLLYRRKVGLTLPIDDWLRDERYLKPFVDMLKEPDAKILAFADRKKLLHYIESFEQKRLPRVPLTRIMPTLVSMEIWMRSLDDDLKTASSGQAERIKISS